MPELPNTKPNVSIEPTRQCASWPAAGWIMPLDGFAPDVEEFLPAALAASRWRGDLYAVPWFVDVGLLYWRPDLFDAPPRSLVELRQAARRARGRGGKIETDFLPQGRRGRRWRHGG